MPAPDDSGRRFGDREVSLILKRAVELQRPSADEGGPGTGLSLADLEQIARDAGLDPAAVRAAAAEVAAGTAGRRRFLGAPARLVVERVVQGEIPDDASEPLVDEIRRTLGEAGLASRLGRTLTWSATWRSPGSGMVRALTLTIAARDGRTVIRGEESLSELAGALFGGLMGGLGGGGVGVGVGLGLAGAIPALVAAGIGTVLVGGSYGLARAIFRRRVAAHARELNALADRLAACAAEAVRSIQAPGPVPPPLPGGPSD